MSRWNIFLDFDLTVAGGHSGGRHFTEISPMDESNKEIFLENLNNWLEKGHNVAIITRGIDTKIQAFFQNILNITPEMNDYKHGEISIYAPDETTFNSHSNSEWWAEKKTEFVMDLITKIGADKTGAKSLFIDDTVTNVSAMKIHFPNMVCQNAEPGNYEDTYASVNNIISSKGGKRNSRRRKFTNKTRRTKLF
jgi:hypothetical protein